MTNEQGKLQNATGELGEKIAQELMPSAVLAPTTGWDMIGLGNELIEVKCSRFSKKYGDWRFSLSTMQIMNSTHIMLIGLDPDGKLSCWWLIPTDEIPTNDMIVNEFNLADYSKWLVNVV